MSSLATPLTASQFLCPSFFVFSLFRAFAIHMSRILSRFRFFRASAIPLTRISLRFRVYLFRVSRSHPFALSRSIRTRKIGFILLHSGSHVCFACCSLAFYPPAFSRSVFPRVRDSSAPVFALSPFRVFAISLPVFASSRFTCSSLPVTQFRSLHRNELVSRARRLHVSSSRSWARPGTAVRAASRR